MRSTDITRRCFVAGATVASAAVVLTDGVADEHRPAQDQNLFGLITKLNAVPQKREDLIQVLGAGISSLPGCISYVIAKDHLEMDAIWITEVWESKALHERSLSLPAVREAIAKGKPLIAKFAMQSATEPVTRFRAAEE